MMNAVETRGKRQLNISIEITNRECALFNSTLGSCRHRHEEDLHDRQLYAQMKHANTMPVRSLCSP